MFSNITYPKSGTNTEIMNLENTGRVQINSSISLSASYQSVSVSYDMFSAEKCLYIHFVLQFPTTYNLVSKHYLLLLSAV